MYKSILSWQLGGEVNINDVSTNYGNVTENEATNLIHDLKKSLTNK